MRIDHEEKFFVVQFCLSNIKNMGFGSIGRLITDLQSYETVINKKLFFCVCKITHFFVFPSVLTKKESIERSFSRFEGTNA